MVRGIQLHNTVSCHKIYLVLGIVILYPDTISCRGQRLQQATKVLLRAAAEWGTSSPRCKPTSLGAQRHHLERLRKPRFRLSSSLVVGVYSKREEKEEKGLGKEKRP